MRNIEITTTQNVTIEYELASARDRIFAYFLDLVILFVFLFVTTLSFIIIFQDGSHVDIFLYVFVIPVVIFYSLVSEIALKGQTLGKRVLGIRVFKLNGKSPSAEDYLIRWAFRLVDIHFTIGTIATMLISSSEQGQRLGDIVAHTTLIRVKFTPRFRLTDIEQIGAGKAQDLQYPNVRQLSENEAVLIKNAIARYQKYPNEAHREALQLLVVRVCNLLEIQEKPRDANAFLKTIIRDYILLTR